MSLLCYRTLSRHISVSRARDFSYASRIVGRGLIVIRLPVTVCLAVPPYSSTLAVRGPAAAGPTTADLDAGSYPK